LNEDEGFWSSDPVIAEPVPHFDHSRRAPLIVLASFSKDSITHIAEGRKGASAGTRLVRLNMKDLEWLPKPVKFRALIDAVPLRVRRHIQDVLLDGGKLPPKSLGAVVDALLKLQPDLRNRLLAYGDGSWRI
jgi:hypothetical protein